MIGLALPSPGILTSHFTCSVSLQRSGGFASGAVPLASGPRHWGQSALWAVSTEHKNPSERMVFMRVEAPWLEDRRVAHHEIKFRRKFPCLAPGERRKIHGDIVALLLILEVFPDAVLLVLRMAL